MAAQKLTRARLIQILVMMAILIAAFVWRTVNYQADADSIPSEPTKHPVVEAQCDASNDICDIDTAQE